jgi:MarR family transcriptional regulator, multiple antibiotic resistance protein MarR
MRSTIHAMASSWQAGVSATSFFDDLVRCETRLYNALNEHLRGQHGISMGQFELMNYLRQAPGSRVGDLASAFAIGIGATSKGIDRLENHGWVQRIPNPADRRSSLLELTPVGEDLADQARRSCEERLSELLDVSPGQLAALATTMATLRRLLERDQIGTPVG